MNRCLDLLEALDRAAEGDCAPAATLYDPIGLQRAADKRNAEAQHAQQTDRFCACGHLATFAWRRDGRDAWRCLECTDAQGRGQDNER
jgi:hypothetical protein